MKKILVQFGFLAFSQLILVSQAGAWALTGHRVVGQIADKFLNKKAQTEIAKLLKDEPESLGTIGNWADEIKSLPDSDRYVYWHFVSLADGQTYADSKKNPEGDVIRAIQRQIEVLKESKSSLIEKKEALKFLVHFVADMHQPLHVGRAEDRGGNDVMVAFFDEPTSLHKVWDEKLIEHKKYSYTELADLLIKKYDNVLDWQKGKIEDWAQESVQLRPLVYEFSESYLSDEKLKAVLNQPIKVLDKGAKPRLGYQYIYRCWPIVEKRLYFAGMRLAKMLNEIYMADKK